MAPIWRLSSRTSVRRAATSFGAIAKALTVRGIETERGKAEWSPMQVSRLLVAIEAVAAG